MGKSSSLQIIRDAQYQTERPNYKNYLQEFKMKRTSMDNTEEDDELRYKGNK